MKKNIMNKIASKRDKIRRKTGGWDETGEEKLSINENTAYKLNEIINFL